MSHFSVGFGKTKVPMAHSVGGSPGCGEKQKDTSHNVGPIGQHVQLDIHRCLINDQPPSMSSPVVVCTEHKVLPV
jgi:hypothetical protein